MKNEAIVQLELVTEKAWIFALHRHVTYIHKGILIPKNAFGRNKSAQGPGNL